MDVYSDIQVHNLQYAECLSLYLCGTSVHMCHPVVLDIILQEILQIYTNHCPIQDWLQAFLTSIILVKRTAVSNLESLFSFKSFSPAWQNSHNYSCIIIIIITYSSSCQTSFKFRPPTHSEQHTPPNPAAAPKSKRNYTRAN